VAYAQSIGVCLYGRLNGASIVRPPVNRRRNSLQGRDISLLKK